MGTVFASWAIRIPDIKRVLGLSDAQLGGVLFASPMGELVSIAPSAWLIGRLGSRRVITLAMTFMPLSLIALGVAGSAGQLFAALFCFGLFNNMLNIALNAQAVGVETLYGHSIMATFHGMWSLGGVAGGLIGAILAPQGIAPLSHFCGIFVFVVVLLLGLRKWTLPREVRFGRTPKGSGLVRYKPDAYLLVLGFIAFGSMATEGAMYDWSSVYFAQVVQPREELVRLGYMACMCFMVLGRLTADGLVTRYGVRPVLQLSGICIAVGLLMALLWPHIVIATAGLALVGFGMASVVPLCYSLAGRSTKVPVSVAISLVSSISFFGFLVCPPMVGFLSHALNLRWALSPIVVVGIAIAGLAALMRYLRA